MSTSAGGTGINYLGSGGMVFGVNTGGTGTEYKVLAAGNNITIVHTGSTITVNATTGAAASGMATTAETYIVIANTDSLSSERALTAGSNLGILLCDSGAGAAIYIVANTLLLVTSTRAINTTAPLAGGGNLSADRTLTADTACLVTSGRSINTTAPVGGGGNLSADRTITVDTACLVTSARTISTTYPLLGGGNLSANRTIVIQTGGAGTMLITSGGVTGDLAWVNTGGGGGSGTVTAGSQNNLAMYTATPTTVDDVLPIGSGGTFLKVNTGGTAHVYAAFVAGDNITLTHQDSAITIAATTGGPGTGTVNAGSATYLAFYPAAGTTVDDATLAVTTGGGIAHFNVSILTSTAASPVSGDVWIQSSNGKIYLCVYSNAAAYSVELSS